MKKGKARKANHIPHRKKFRGKWYDYDSTWSHESNAQGQASIKKARGEHTKIFKMKQMSHGNERMFYYLYIKK